MRFARIEAVCRNEVHGRFHLFGTNAGMIVFAAGGDVLLLNGEQEVTDWKCVGYVF